MLLFVALTVEGASRRRRMTLQQSAREPQACRGAVGCRNVALDGHPGFR
jgi:hypothetical protein